MLPAIREIFKKIVFGDTWVPLEFTVGIREPQTETVVYLRGLGEPIDVTYHYSTACCAPLVLCVAVERVRRFSQEMKERDRFALVYHERRDMRQVLARIDLKLSTVVEIDSLDLMLFEVRHASNYCLPKPRFWAHSLLHAYSQWKNAAKFSLNMTFLDFRASHITFIRPHPLALISVMNAAGGNLFPMNLLGELGDGYFGLALREDRLAAHLVEESCRIAVSNVPLEKSSVAFRLAGQHTRTSIDWKALPFALRRSKLLGIPVPEFASRVREMEIEKVFRLGSHTFFIARTLSDEIDAERVQVNVIHGFYQWRRMRGQPEQLKQLISEDAVHKHGPGVNAT
jgi:flavin reductase (DIM6/NTAB) family NADH-FMN oxidoreductase RutF